MRVLVIGDSCEDIFVYGNIIRLSPEAPVPILQPIKETKNGGMALNVYNNFLSLGVEVDIITNEKSQIRKVRYVDNRSSQMVLRIDENDECEEIDEITRMHICNNQYQDKTYDAIVISDYCKGFLSKTDIELLCKTNKNVFIDTKKQLGKWIEYATFIKINSFEYKKNYDYFNTNGFTDKLIVTLGGEGCLYNGKNYPVKKVSVKDVSGAGDTFLAGLVYGYLDTNSIYKAIKFAQECTTIVVQKHGVSTV
jgi:D-beta-D-heptose 7-phosphate kinase/D-beta-D-heptose 1-phosphate adenosyltransferase